MHTIQPSRTSSNITPRLRIDDAADNCQPDMELLALFLETGNRSALEPLVVRYSGLVYSVVSKVVYQSQDREDACQATFLSLVRSASKIRNQQSIAGWLCSVAFRIALRMRQHHRVKPGSLSVEEMQMLTEQTPDPLSQIAQDMEFEKLNVELQRLPSELRGPLLEHYFLGLSAPAIAERMELSVSAVEGRLRRGKQRLRTALARKGIGLSIVTGAVASIANTGFAASERVGQICVHAIHHSATSATAIGQAASGGGSILCASTYEINARVLSLVQGEMTMSSIGLAKVAYGTGLGLCAIFAASVVSNFLVYNPHDGGAGQTLAISASYAVGPETGGELTTKSQDLRGGAASAYPNPYPSSDTQAAGPAGTEGVAGSGLALGESRVATAASPNGDAVTETSQAWKVRGDLAASKIEGARSTMEEQTIDALSLKSSQELFEKIAELTQLPVVFSPNVEPNISSLEPVSFIRYKLQLGKKSQLPVRDLLEMLLAQYPNVGYVIRSNRIEIVPSEESNTVRMYNVRAIVPAPEAQDQQNLMQLVLDFVLQDKHQDKGGSAKISMAGSTMIVWCDEPTHRQVQEFLGQVSQIEGGLENTNSGLPGGLGVGGQMGGGMF